MSVHCVGHVMLNVLVCEDDAAVAAVLERILGLEGHSCTLTPSAEAALQAIKARPPDILLTDLGLPPPMNGVALAAAARELIADLPVVVITGYADQTDEERVAEMGLMLLRKPFGRDLLVDALRAARSGGFDK